MTSVLNKTVHRGSRSIDFISNSVKASITAPKEPVYAIEKKISKLRAGSTPVHPFYRPSDAKKLIKAVRYRHPTVAGPLTYWGSVTESKNRVEFEPSFDSSREVMEFFRKMEHGCQTLKTIPDIEFDLNIPEDVTMQIDEQLQKCTGPLREAFEEQLITKFGTQHPSTELDAHSRIAKYHFHCLEHLKQIHETQYFSKNGIRVTKEDKTLYIIKKLLSEDPYALKSLSKIIREYVGSVHNYRIATDAVILLFQEIKKHELEAVDQELILKTLTTFQNTLKALYPEARDDPRLLDTNIKIVYRFFVPRKAKKQIDDLIKMGYSPDAASLGQYVKTQYEKKENSYVQKRELWNSMIGLDDAFYTVMDKNIAGYLIKASDTLDEVDALLNMIKKTVKGEDLSEFYKTVEPVVVKIGAEGQNFEFPLRSAQKVQFFQRFEQTSKLSYESKRILLINTIHEGNLLYAFKLLREIKIDENLLRELKKQAKRRSCKYDNDFPGFDRRSLEALKRRLDTIEVSEVV